jgi:hypothetical protein
MQLRLLRYVPVYYNWSNGGILIKIGKAISTRKHTDGRVFCLYEEDGMYRYVVLCKLTEVSEVHAASIFRVEE